MVSLVARGAELNNSNGLSRRALPEPAGDGSVDAFISGIFNGGQVLGAPKDGDLIANWFKNAYLEANPKPAVNQQFDDYVTKPLSGQYPQSGPFANWKALTDVPQGTFALDQHPQVFIATPGFATDPNTGVKYTPQNSPPKYPGPVDQIVAAIDKIIPGIPTGSITKFNYFAKSSPQALQNVANGKALTNYDPHADLESSKPFGYQTWGEGDVALQDAWGSCSGNQKRQVDGSCPASISGSGSASASGSSTATSSTSTSSSSGSSGFSTSTTSRPSSITSVPSTTSSSSTSQSIICSPFADPDAGPGHSGCQCDGTTGLIPMMSNTASASDFNICGYTALPATVTSTSVPPFTTTDSSNGDVYSCATSTYFNYAVNTQASCAGASTVVSTVSSIYASYQSSKSVASASAASVASASSASASSASAASASAAAATPSGSCKLWDTGVSYLIQVYDINTWGGDGSGLKKQEKGCGALTDWDWVTGCDGDTSIAWFQLPFFIKSGCVERAIHSAGGPSGLKCEGEGVVFDEPDGQAVCNAMRGLNVQKLAVANKQLASSSVSSITTTHALAVPGNTEAVKK
ncbi:MAG: hypothetical protein Q9162_003962 [Coniocarpon cinnabarinum]